MHKPLRTLLLASFCCLPGALFARTAAPFVQPAQEINLFAFPAWTPTQLHKAQSTSTADIDIILPYRGQHNDWTITLNSYTHGTFTFTTNSASNPNHYLYPLGSVPVGTYNITYYNHNSQDAEFDFSFGCADDWWQSRYGEKEYTLYNVEFTEECNDIIIDANY